MKNIVLKVALAGFAIMNLPVNSFSQATAQKADHPNVILLMADDLGWGEVGYNGNKEIITPNLDKMSRSGVSFNRYYTAAPICSPTRGSILTGRHPYRFGVMAAHSGGMRQGEVTIPEICKDNDYTTGFFGKWHLGHVEPEVINPRGYYSPPWQNGYDVAFATRSAVPTWNPTKTPSYWKGFGAEKDGSWGASRYVLNGKVVTENLEGDDSRIIMDRAIPFIQKAVKEKKPFFATIWFHAPHMPVLAGPKYLAMYKNMEPELKRNYYGCITAMDEQIGRLREQLKEMGIDKNTIIFFTSDNGTADPIAKAGIGSTGIFRGHKHMVYEGGVRVPSLVIWPGTIKPAQKVDTRMCSYDYLPTIVDLANLKFKKPKDYAIDGISMKPEIFGKKMERDTTIFTAWMRLHQGVNGRALVGERYKLVIPEKSEIPELYDLKVDPGEKNNVIKEHPEVAKAMEKEIKAWLESCMESYEGKDYTL